MVYIHYADISDQNGINCNINDRVNGLRYSLQLEKDEVKYVKKCKSVAIVFLKHKPEDVEIKVKKVK